MRLKCLLCIIFISITSCDANKLNKFASNLNKNVEEKFDNLTKDTPDLASSKPKMTTLQETNDTLKGINESYRESKESIKETKQSIKEGVQEAKQSARRYARKLPRSQAEANKMLIAFGEKYFGGWRTQFNKVKRQRGQTNSKPVKVESRLR